MLPSRIRISQFVALLLVLVTVVSCQSSDPVQTPTETGHTVTDNIPVTVTIQAEPESIATETPIVSTQIALALGSEPPTLDPHRTSDISASDVFGRVCETLVYLGFDLTDQPLLAESWAFSEDYTSLTMTLRQGVTFHDGTPFNATAVKFTFERLQQPESVDSPIYTDFQDVIIETPEEYTITFRFPEPRINFLRVLRNSYAVIVSPAAVTADEDVFGRQPVCTGPYEVDVWEPSQYIRLRKNPNYNWAPAFYTNQGPALIDEILIRFTDSHETAYLGLLNGELDMLSLSTPEEVAEIKGMPDQFTLYESWVGGISFLGFNWQSSTVGESQPLVREAIAHAIDKQTIINTVLSGMAEPAFAPLAPSIYGYSQELQQYEYTYDPVKSRELLAQAGYVDSNGDGIVERDGQPLHMVLLTNTSNTYSKIYVLIENQLKEVGITTKFLQAENVADITPTCEQFDLLLYHYSWPFSNALSLFLTTEKVGETNRVCYSNPTVDGLLAEADLYPDGSTEKEALLLEAQQLILLDAPWQPLLVRKIVLAVNNRVQGVLTHPAGGLLLHDATAQ